MRNAIEATDLTKYYGDLLAVDHASFDVRQGEVFGFLGPNGAGKTTTIRMLTGLSRPTAGTASVLDFDVNSEIVKAKKHIGVVPEISNLYDELSTMDNLLFMAQLYGVPRDQRKMKAEELLRIFGLHERRDDSFRILSRGMKRALTIAAALIHSPKLLFLDEPTANLDINYQVEIFKMLKKFNEEMNKTIVLITHDINHAARFAKRIVLLNKGVIVKIGDSGEVINVRDLKSVFNTEVVIKYDRERKPYILI